MQFVKEHIDAIKRFIQLHKLFCSMLSGRNIETPVECDDELEYPVPANHDKWIYACLFDQTLDIIALEKKIEISLDPRNDELITSVLNKCHSTLKKLIGVIIASRVQEKTLSDDLKLYYMIYLQESLESILNIKNDCWETKHG